MSVVTDRSWQGWQDDALCTIPSLCVLRISSKMLAPCEPSSLRDLNGSDPATTPWSIEKGRDQKSLVRFRWLGWQPAHHA